MSFIDLLVVGVLVTSSAWAKEGETKWDHMKVKFDPPSIGKYNIALTKSQIDKNEYRLLQTHEGFPNVQMYIYKDDPRVQIMYDGFGNICGMRVAYVIDELDKRTPRGKTFPYTFDDKPIYKKGRILNKECYYVDVFFVDPAKLKLGEPDFRKELVGTGLYVNIDGDTWTEMPRLEKKTKDTVFTEQACFPGMGRHYFYNMTTSMRCEDHLPIFLLYLKGDLIGFGLIPIGTFDSKMDRPWFEDPPGWIISTIVPHAPTCLAEWVSTYGTTSLHVYFRESNAFNCVLP